MFGIPDAGVLLAIITSLLSAVACVVYGIIYWNKGDEPETEGVKKE